jgi:hypothetical protein
MSGFVKQQLDIGSKQPQHQYKVCNKCESMKPPEGGIQMSPSKWHCALCWTKRATVRNLNGERR